MEDRLEVVAHRKLEEELLHHQEHLAILVPEEPLVVVEEVNPRTSLLLQLELEPHQSAVHQWPHHHVLEEVEVLPL